MSRMNWRAPATGLVRLRDSYLAPRVETNRRVTLDACLEQCRETGRLDSYRLDWKEGMPNQPHIFWDSDVAKVVEGLALDLILHPDSGREKKLDEIVAAIVAAQQPDGYLNVHFTIVNPAGRWFNLRDYHELYCAGHLMEAAVAHHAATGKTNFLDAMVRYADYIAKVFGPGPEQKHGYPGHEEIELALCKLAAATGQPRHAELARYFVNERGREPNYFLEEDVASGRRATSNLDYYQAHLPVREQKDAVGHAVRALYLYTGMADVAGLFDDDGLLDACRRLWRSVVERRMYITGGVGQTPIGESFTVDYNLPNDTAYAESCAAMALVQFSRRLLDLTGEGRYADAMERALFNGALSGIDLAGDRFFYANLLEVDSDTFAHGVTQKVRQHWFNCSCCPTSYCRFLPQLGNFALSVADDGPVLHFPAALDAKLETPAGNFAIAVDGGYPYDGLAIVTLREVPAGETTLRLRIPGWCKQAKLFVNGEAVDAALPEKLEDGYAVIRRAWRPGEQVAMELSMPSRWSRANVKVSADAGKLALERGPLVYAVESVDNGGNLGEVVVAPDAEFTPEPVDGLTPGAVALRGPARREEVDNPGDELYFNAPATRKDTSLLAIPSALWQNRGESAMRVWLRSE